MIKIVSDITNLIKQTFYLALAVLLMLFYLILIKVITHIEDDYLASHWLGSFVLLAMDWIFYKMSKFVTK
ncbi:hypothetical protein OLP40_03865 [Campylobacter jejuni]|nr:hypothetical protein [Campylobacter jejuni]